ncbi:hypothetical protein TIFTF001_036396, partial [Ficus carica]
TELQAGRLRAIGLHFKTYEA